MLFDVSAFQDAGNTVLGLSRCLQADSCDSHVYDLSKCKWMQIGEMVALASFFRAQRAKKLKLGGRYSPNSDVGLYLSRMDFFKVQDIVRDESFRRHDSNERFLTLTPIRQDENTNEIPGKLRNIVLAKTDIDRSLVGALDYAFGEIVDNVLTHSRTPVEGLVGAQYYPSKGFVEFCVADGGVGVANTLRNNPAYCTMDDSELLIKAFEHGVGEDTSGFAANTKGYGCGFGLTFAARLVAATGGDLWMVSNTAGVHLQGSGVTQHTGFNAVGTTICMRIPSNVRVTEDDVLKNGVNRLYNWDSVGDGSDSADDILW